MTNFADVGAFHSRFGLSVSTDGKPRELPKDLLDFRVNFLQEELDEFWLSLSLESSRKEEPIEHDKVFDALLDIVYVAMGTAHLLGYPWEEGWELVQRANMTKVRAENPAQSKRNSTWDVVKPPGWEAPDIAGLLAKKLAL